jgi:ATP-binding cassette, subfamily B, bacterial PglK
MCFARGALDAIDADLRLSVDLEPLAPEPSAPLPFASEVALQDVTYAYPEGGEPALRGVSLAIPRHRSVAIVGRTCSGKTTLVDVLLGLAHGELGGPAEVDGAGGVGAPFNRRNAATNARRPSRWLV